MNIEPIKTRIFHEGESLLDFIEEHIDIISSSRISLPQLSPTSPSLPSQTSPSLSSRTEGEICPLNQEHVLRFHLEGQGQHGESNSESQNQTPCFDLEGQKIQEIEQDFSFHSKGQKQTNKILEEGDILVITSKIVALAEGRTFFAHTPEEKIEYIKKESSSYTRTKYIHLTIHDRMPMANAGIDESNGNGRCIMLPKDSYESAYKLWLQIKEKYQLANFGIIITDSRTIPFRNGTTGVSLGHAGFESIRDYRGKPDIFGRDFLYARTNVPDALATAAVHLMGEGDECQPLALIKNARVVYSKEKQNGDDLIIDPEDDIYAPLFSTNIDK